MSLQSNLAEILLEVGLPKEARTALSTSHRWPLTILGNKAILTASPDTRFHVAQRVKLALDDVANGGPGLAKDYEIRMHEHFYKKGEKLYRIYGMDGKNIGLMYENRDTLLKSLISAHTVKNIIYNDSEISPWPPET